VITLITGRPGHGKTLFALTHIQKYLAEQNKGRETPRPVFYHNIRDLKLPWVKLDEPKAWPTLEDSAVIVLDECQDVFPIRATGSAVPGHVSAINTHRHHGHDLFLITQDPMLLDSAVRKLVDTHYHLERKFGFETANLHKWNRVKEDCLKNRQGSEQTTFNYPKTTYGLYHSAVDHTVKAKLPLRVKLAFAIPVLLVGLGFIAWKYLNPETSNLNPANTIEAQQQLEPDPRRASGYMQAAAPELDYYQQRAPRLEGLPHTAPVYDEITKPVEVPLPSACIEIRGTCTCYSQQGTRMATPENICRQIVERGFFIDFENGDALKAEQRPIIEPLPVSSRVVSEAPEGGETVAPAPVGDPRTPS